MSRNELARARCPLDICRPLAEADSHV
jgi:hypothetical protein